jgi:hypothetical protein
LELEITLLPRAVSQLLWPDKDREVWFCLGENHENAYRFPDFLQRSTGREQLPATFFAESRRQFAVVPPTSTGNPGSVYTNCETALAATVDSGAGPLSLVLM